MEKINSLILSNLREVNNLKVEQLKDSVYSVYGYNTYTTQELFNQFTNKLNEVIDLSNTTIDLTEYLVNEGLGIEVAIKLTNWLNDGTLENIIGKDVLGAITTTLDILTTDMKEIKDNVYYVKETDNIQDVLNTHKNIIIPEGINFEITNTLVTGFEGQNIKGFNNIIHNKSTMSDVVREKKSTLNIIHKNVTIEGLVFIGEQMWNSNTQKEDISTGHNIYISNLPNANTLIRNCSAINGYNGYTVENGSSHVTIENCVSTNCEHGVQIYEVSSVVVKNHTHIIKPHGKSQGYSQRSLKVQRNCKDILVDNFTADTGRVCGIYIRNEEGDLGDIKNINLLNIMLKNGLSLIEGYTPYSGIYFEHGGSGVFDNIVIDNANINIPQNGITIGCSNKSLIKNLTLNNITVKNSGGRSLGVNSNVYPSPLKMDNIKVNNFNGNDIFVNCNNSIISNVITNVDLIVGGNNNITSNINYNKPCFSFREIVLLEGVYSDSQIPYPSDFNKTNSHIISCAVFNSSGNGVNANYTLGGNIALDSANNGKTYKILIGR